MDQRPEQLKAKLTTFYNTGQKLNRKPGYEFLGRGGGLGSSGSPYGLRSRLLHCRWELLFCAALSEHEKASKFGPLPPLL